MYHIFFIHLSVDGHLGCFYDMAIVNSAAVNIGVHISFGIMVFSGYMPSLPGSNATSFSYDSLMVLIRSVISIIICLSLRALTVNLLAKS